MSYDSEQHHRRSIRLKDYDYSLAGAYFLTICTHGHRQVFGEIVDGEIRRSGLGRRAAACWEEIPAHFPQVELDAFVVMPNHVHGIIVITGDNGPVGAENFPPPRGAIPATSAHGTGSSNTDGVGAENFPPVPDAAPTAAARGTGACETDGLGAKDFSPLQNAGPPVLAHGMGASNTGGADNRGGASAKRLPLGPSRTVGSIVRGFKIGVTVWARQQDLPLPVWQRNYWEHIIRNEAELFRVRQYIYENPAAWASDRLHPDYGASGPADSARESAAPYGVEDWMR